MKFPNHIFWKGFPGRVLAQSDGLLGNGELIVEFQLRRSYHICFTVSEKTRAQVYLDGKLGCAMHCAWSEPPSGNTPLELRSIAAVIEMM
jgi:hypothetical protein